jgi:hypothetical protein
VLPAGRPPLDTGAVLQQPAFRAVIGELRDWADFVVIVAPPVLASADAELLADLADMTLLVADARRSTRAGVQAAMRELAQFRDKLVGCVLTGVGMRRLLAHSNARAPVANSSPPGTSSWPGDSRAQPAGVADDGHDSTNIVRPQGEDDQ